MKIELWKYMRIWRKIRFTDQPPPPRTSSDHTFVSTRGCHLSIFYREERQRSIEISSYSSMLWHHRYWTSLTQSSPEKLAQKEQLLYHSHPRQEISCNPKRNDNTMIKSNPDIPKLQHPSAHVILGGQPSRQQITSAHVILGGQPSRQQITSPLEYIRPDATQTT
jgi:hypothetical protein